MLRAKRVLAADGLLDAGYKLVQRFRITLHDLDVTAFKHWLLNAAASELKPFARLAAGTTDGLEAPYGIPSFPNSTHRFMARAEQVSAGRALITNVNQKATRETQSRARWRSKVRPVSTLRVRLVTVGALLCLALTSAAPIAAASGGNGNGGRNGNGGAGNA